MRGREVEKQVSGIGLASLTQEETRQAASLLIFFSIATLASNLAVTKRTQWSREKTPTPLVVPT